MAKPKPQIKNLKALNANQKKALRSTKNKVLMGSAGTGKSLLAVFMSMKAVERDDVDNLIIVRSAVPTRDVGYLPGSLDDKIQVFELPYEEIFEFLYDDKDAYRLFKNKFKQVQFMTSSYLRGITLEDCHIVVDEFQNMSLHELDSIITRMGENCYITFCGDIKQSDLKKEQSGLLRFIKIIKRLQHHFDIVEFTVEDVVRSGLVRDYLRVKEELDG